MNLAPHSLQVQRQALIGACDRILANAPDRHCVLAIIDIRDFRELNHSFGIQFGDVILLQIAKRLDELRLESTNYYYLGNDEFAILLDDPANPGIALVHIENILSLFRDPFGHDGHSIKITVNCGVANNFSQHNSTSQLLFDSELALRQAKSANRPYIWLEQEKQQTSSRSKWHLLNSLHKALEDQQLSLYCQPKIPLHKNTPAGAKILASAEGLIRWETEDQGILAPKITLPLIEHLGSEIELIEWLLNTGLKQLSIADQELKTKNADQFTTTISINIPPSIETIEALDPIVANVLSIWQIDPERLTLEITEDILIREKQKVFDQLSLVRARGVKISIDDFGTGFSSLAYFKHIPADELKIDQSFIKNMLNDETDRKIVKLIIDIAHTFGLSVLAEGVEDQATAQALKAMGCDYAQGFHFSKAIPHSDYLNWLSANKNLYL